jgi:3-oxoacyl-[acyl-carrier-protein] synthase-3
MRTLITGSGIALGENVVRNDALARIMDTSDEWIRTRSGIEERRYVSSGQGSLHLGKMAAAQAMASAGVAAGDIDGIVFATMTPDYFFPGNAPLLQDEMGIGRVPAFDIRQQCSGFLYGLDLADSLIRSGKHRTLLLIGADVHTPFMPWNQGWDKTIGMTDREITPAEFEANTKIRDRTVLFGDGGGAVVVQAVDDDGRGYLGGRLYSDGSGRGALIVKGIGFRKRPFVTAEDISSGEIIPHMEGREVFKQAVTLMPQAVREVAAECGVKVEDIDLLLVHQANLRIIEGVQKALGLAPDKVPHNIERYGNTTAGTLPILFHECREKGLIRPGMLICFTALGSGLHWGAALYRA